MKLLLAAVTVVLAALWFSDAGLAQGCASACAKEHSNCQRHFAELGSACRKRCGKSASCGAACEKRETAYANECSRQNRGCVRACGGR